MKFLNPNILIATISSLGVLAFVVKDVQRTHSPGDLSSVHHRVEGLADSDSCAQCHGNSRVSADNACLECHGVIEAHLDSGTGLHGSLDLQTQRACAMCHSEHHGAGFPLINARSFSIAGISDVNAFDHAMVGFTMEGAHLEQDCQACHPNMEDEILAEGTHRFIGLSQDCATCHEDPHGGQMANACVSCHNQSTFQNFARFEHDKGLTLAGAHLDVTCLDCHEAGSAHAVEALAKPNHGVVARGCADCHADPHSGDFLKGLTSFADTLHAASSPSATSCALCHKETDFAFAFEEPRVTPEMHLASGFALESPHQDLSCSECHGTPQQAFNERFPGREALQCAACHEDPHQGQFIDSPFADVGCTGCHTQLEFAPHAFTAAFHDQTAMPLQGAHASLECQACHADPAGGEARLFRGTSSRCDACHSDVHTGFFDTRGAEDCSTCHSDESFSDAHAENFDHGAWTGFALDGAHAQNACESCHVPSKQEDILGRSFGRITEVFGDVAGCATCHANPHGSAFVGKDLPMTVEGEVGCMRCHSEVSFRQAAHEFEHGLWTGFELAGSHAGLSCATCHTPRLIPDESGRTWDRAAGSSCSDCHTDTHGKQFEVAGVTDCAGCHSTGASFQELIFDHDVHSRFPLDEAHQSVSCSQCHRRPKGKPDDPIQYKPLGIECVDCHGGTRRTPGETEKASGGKR